MATYLQMKGFKKAQKKFDSMEKKLKNPSTAMKVIGQIGSRDIVEHFNKTEGPGGRKWKALKSPRKNGGSKPLNDKGVLRNTMRVEAGRYFVTLIKNVKYAAIHNEGYAARNIAQRKFMYTTKTAKKSMVKTLLRYIIGSN